MRVKYFFRIFLLFFMTTAIIWVFPAAVPAEEQKENVKEVVVKEQEIQHESGIYYTIQKGDTLWDLSERFFDSPALWPGLWQENHQIPNPHWRDDRCHSCHTSDQPSRRKPALRHKDRGKLCNTCHDPLTQHAYIHPSDIVPGPDMQQRMPKPILVCSAVGLSCTGDMVLVRGSDDCAARVGCQDRARCSDRSPVCRVH